jgi:hypothetical protein
MNANELADKLEDDYWDSRANKVMLESAKMLIQQQDRIEVLEANHKIQLDINEKALQYIAELEKGLESSLNLNKAQAERHMNNEPVAWMYESKNVDGKPYISDVSLKPLFGLVTRYGYKEIPLYTHPHPDNLGFALSIIDQQKLEIEELKQYTKKGNGLLAECDEHMGKLQALILKQDARIAELEKCAEYYRDKYYFDSPAKTLTDEEILDLCPPNHSDMMNEAYTIDFARAILKKASEK